MTITQPIICSAVTILRQKKPGICAIIKAEVFRERGAGGGGGRTQAELSRIYFGVYSSWENGNVCVTV
jgi:hypothetical protein